MTRDKVLESLAKSNSVIDRAMNRLDALKYMFIPEIMIESRQDGFVCDGVEIVTVYEDENTNVVLGKWKSGSVYPKHFHKESVEYLVVTKGKMLLKIGDAPRVMLVGECAAVSVGQDHSVAALEDSEMIAICVPPERAYSNV